MLGKSHTLQSQNPIFGQTKNRKITAQSTIQKHCNRIHAPHQLRKNHIGQRIGKKGSLFQPLFYALQFVLHVCLAVIPSTKTRYKQN